MIALAAHEDVAVHEAVARNADIAVVVLFDLSGKPARVLFLTVDRAVADDVVRVAVQPARKDAAGRTPDDLGVEDRKVFDVALSEIVADVAEQSAVLIVHAHDAQVFDRMVLSVERAEERAMHALALVPVGKRRDRRNAALRFRTALFGDRRADPLLKRRHVKVRRQHIRTVAGRVGRTVAVRVVRLPDTGQIQQLLGRSDLIIVAVRMIGGQNRAE